MSYRKQSLLVTEQGNVVVLFGKPPGSQNQCFSTYFNQEKSSNGGKYYFPSPGIVFGPILGKKHGRNQDFLFC